MTDFHRGDPGSSPLPRHEVILLVVPARAEMWSVVRITASTLAAKLDFSFDGIEDLRLAVTEICGTCALGAGADADCECRFILSGDRLEMHCQVFPIVANSRPRREPRLLSKFELSAQILEATVDDHRIEPVSETGVRRGFLCKQRASVW
jgi:hypothetical protein